MGQFTNLPTITPLSSLEEIEYVTRRLEAANRGELRQEISLVPSCLEHESEVYLNGVCVHCGCKPCRWTVTADTDR